MFKYEKSNLFIEFEIAKEKDIKLSKKPPMKNKKMIFTQIEYNF